MNEAMNGHKFKVGDRVRYIKKDNEFGILPPIGTIGVVTNEADLYYLDKESVRVDFSESHWFFDDDSVWPVQECNLELVEDSNNNMTDEEIWNMLKPKMEKNGLISRCSRIEIRADALPTYTNAVIKCYDESDVHKAIALAYKSGYLRSQKGRPFKIDGDKEPTNEG